MKYHEIAEQGGVTVGKVKMDASRGKLDKNSPESVAAYLKALRGDKDAPDLFSPKPAGYIKPAETVPEPEHAPPADLSVNAGRKKTSSAVAHKVDLVLAVADAAEKQPEYVAPGIETVSVPTGDPLVEGSNAWLLSHPVGFLYKGFSSFFVEVRIGSGGRKELKCFPRSDGFVPCKSQQPHSSEDNHA